MISARGLTMSKVAHIRQALHQICADEQNDRSMTALIMAEHDVSQDDVMDMCDVVQDVVADFRNREIGAMCADAG